jgi:hypothetical protein
MLWNGEDCSEGSGARRGERGCDWSKAYRYVNKYTPVTLEPNMRHFMAIKKHNQGVAHKIKLNTIHG